MIRIRVTEAAANTHNAYSREAFHEEIDQLSDEMESYGFRLVHMEVEGIAIYTVWSDDQLLDLGSTLNKLRAIGEPDDR